MFMWGLLLKVIGVYRGKKDEEEIMRGLYSGFYAR